MRDQHGTSATIAWGRLLNLDPMGMFPISGVQYLMREGEDGRVWRESIFR